MNNTLYSVCTTALTPPHDEVLISVPGDIVLLLYTVPISAGPTNCNCEFQYVYGKLNNNNCLQLLITMKHVYI